MDLDWDEEKRQKTLHERGLDFVDVGAVDWENAIFIPDARREHGEPRETMMGLLEGRLLIIAFTMRGNTVRVISMRKANRRERKIYDSFGT